MISMFDRTRNETFAAPNIKNAMKLCVAAAFFAMPTYAAQTKHAYHQRNAVTLPPLPVPKSVAPAAIQVAPASDQMTDETVLYQGEASSPAGVQASDWGGGSGKEVQSLYLRNGHSIQVDTKSLYEGAILTLGTPLSVPSLTDGKNHVLVFQIRFAQPATDSNDNAALPLQAPVLDPFAQEQTRTADYTGGATFQLAQRRRENRGHRGSGRRGGSGRFPGYPGGPDQSDEQDVPETFPVQLLRFELAFDNNTKVDIFRTVPEPADTTGGNLDSWVDIGIPFKALNLDAATAASHLTAITVGADATATFYIGEIKVVDDEVPISAFAGDRLDIAQADAARLHATANGGESMLNYSWNFGQGNSETVDASGSSVEAHYLKGGKDYTVTLTVSDADGIKKPVVTTTTVKVEE